MPTSTDWLTYNNLEVLPRHHLALDSCCRTPPDEFRSWWKEHFPACEARQAHGYSSMCACGISRMKSELRVYSSTAVHHTI